VQAGVLAAYGNLKSEVEETTLAEESLTRQTLLNNSASDPDPVRSGIICRIWIRNSNFGSGSGKDPELDLC